MTGFAKVLAVLMLIVSVIALIGGIGISTEVGGTEQDIAITGGLVSAFTLAGAATVVWNVGVIAATFRKKTTEE